MCRRSGAGSAPRTGRNSDCPPRRHSIHRRVREVARGRQHSPLPDDHVPLRHDRGGTRSNADDVAALDRPAAGSRVCSPKYQSRIRTALSGPFPFPHGSPEHPPTRPNCDDGRPMSAYEHNAAEVIEAPAPRPYVPGPQLSFARPDARAGFPGTDRTRELVHFDPQGQPRSAATIPHSRANPQRGRVVDRDLEGSRPAWTPTASKTDRRQAHHRHRPDAVARAIQPTARPGDPQGASHLLRPAEDELPDAHASSCSSRRTGRRLTYARRA